MDATDKTVSSFSLLLSVHPFIFCYFWTQKWKLFLRDPRISERKDVGSPTKTAQIILLMISNKC